MAFLAENDRGFYMVVDGKRYGHYRGHICDSLVFSFNSEHFAYIAGFGLWTGALKYTGVLDGKKQERFDELIFVAPMFSPDSKDLIYMGADKKFNRFSVINGVRGQKFEETGHGPHYSNAHSAFMFMGLRNDTANLMINDSIAESYFDLWHITTSSTTNDFAYTARQTKESIQTVYLNNQPFTNYYATKDPKFSPNGKRFAFWASDGENQFAVVDSVEDPKYDNVSDVRFSSGSKHYYYIVFYSMEPNKWAYSINGNLMPIMEGTLDKIGVDFSPDESRWAIKYNVDSNYFNVILDDTLYEGYSDIGNIVFSPNNEHVAFICDRDTTIYNNIFYDGKEIIYDGVVGTNILFSEDSQDIFYWVSTTESKKLYINHKEFASYKNTYPLELKYNNKGDIVFYTFKENSLYKVTVSKNKK
jgi:hypothetical protein